MPKGRVPRLRLLSELDLSLGACDSSEIAKPHFLKDTMTQCASPQGALLFHCSIPCIRMDSGKVTQLSVFMIKLPEKKSSFTTGFYIF